MSAGQLPQVLQQVEAVVAKAHRRAALQAYLSALVPGALYGAWAALLAVLLWRLSALPPAAAWWLLALIPVSMLIWPWLRKPPTPEPYQVAKRLDRQLALNDRLAAAFDLARRLRAGETLPEGPFADLLLDDAAMALSASRALRLRISPPPRLLQAAAWAMAAALLPWLLAPGEKPVEQALAFSTTERAEMERLNKELSEIAESISALDNVAAEEKSKLLDKLAALKMSDSDIKKMNRLEWLRRMKQMDVATQAPGQEGEVMAAARDRMEALAEEEIIRKHLAETEALNQAKTLVDVEGGKAVVDNVQLLTDRKLDPAALLAAVTPGAETKRVLERLDIQATQALTEHSKIKNLLNPAARKLEAPKTDADKLQRAISTDKNFQGEVLGVIHDRKSQGRKPIGELYRKMGDQETQEMPSGKRSQIQNYIHKLTGE